MPDGPDMDIMDNPHTRDSGDHLRQDLCVKAQRREVEEYPEGLLYDTGPADDYHASDDAARYGIRKHPAGKFNDQSGDDYACRRNRIAEYMEPGAFHIQVVMFMPEYPCHDEVAHKSGCSY